MKNSHKERCARIMHYGKDLFGLSDIQDARKLWAKWNKELKRKDEIQRKTQKTVDILRREINKTPSRKHQGKHHISDDGYSCRVSELV